MTAPDEGNAGSRAGSAGPYYHGTKADLKPGDLISPGYRGNYGTTDRRSRWVYMTATLSPLGAELARGEGPGRLYIVEPTGPFVDDPDLTDKRFPGNPTRSYRSRHPLRVLGEVTGWTPHSPEEIRAILDRQARLYALQAERIARIPTAGEVAEIRARADGRAGAWTPAPEFAGCLLLMRFRGTETEVHAAVSYASEAVAAGASTTVELPGPIDLRPGERPEALPLSGWVTDIEAWREAWSVVIESCVTEIGLSLEARLWIAADAEHGRLRFRLDADGPERSWQRRLLLERGVLTDDEQGELWGVADGG